MKGQASHSDIRFGKIRSPDQLCELLFTFMVTVITGIQDNDNIIAGRQVLLCIPVDFLENASGVITLNCIPIFSNQCNCETACIQTVALRHEFRTATTGSNVRFIKNPRKIRFAFQPL
jgi:hypothetical protein